ncbi:MAG: hypothetical protein WC536_04335 [Patescibacteria group bacterium]
MEAQKDEEQLLNSEVADIRRRLEERLKYYEENCSSSHKLKAAWLKAAISALQGFSHVDNPPKRWEQYVKIVKGEEKNERNG